MATVYVRCSSRQAEISKSYLSKQHGHKANTYPWPYANPQFASWMEEDALSDDPHQRDLDDALISDQDGFVIRHPTSYCAWKIYEQTGKRPKRIKGDQWHSKYWVKLLFLNGYREIVPAEEIEEGHHYVGVMPDVGEHGMVVWFEKHGFKTMPCMPAMVIGSVLQVSTYLPPKYSETGSEENYGFAILRVEKNDLITWVKID